ncbi:MAG: hypothetical protein AABW45_01180 [Nanoarchaeota archaeon]
MLKQISIDRIKESNYKSKLRAYIKQRNKLKILYLKEIIKRNNYRNFNSVILNKSESNLHNYAKFITSLTCIKNNQDVLTEYNFQDINYFNSGINLTSNPEADVYLIDRGIIVELENNGCQDNKINNKLDNYKELLDNEIINDVFIISLQSFTGNLEQDCNMIKERLGL